MSTNTPMNVQTVIHIVIPVFLRVALLVRVVTIVCLVTCSAPSLKHAKHVQLAVQTVQVLEHVLMVFVAAIQSILVEAAKDVIHNAYLAV
jgi:hypothetical protein